MNELMQFLANIGSQTLWVGGAVFLRVGAAMAVFPAFGEQMLPARIRLLLALMFTAILAPAVSQLFHLPESPAQIGIGFMAEIIIGLSLGLAIRFFVLALQTAGTIAAQSTSLSQIFGGAGEPAPAIGHILFFAGLALAVMNDLHVRLAEYLLLSYTILPFGRLPDAQALTEWGVNGLVRVFALAFTLSAPFLIASLVYNFALGIINRAMPQLMVTFVGAPAITAGGMLLMIAAAPVLLLSWKSAVEAFFLAPF
ncbi:flagellar biosynthetic protein FliR [Rhodobacteraceae bacterium MYP1-1]|uniref:Flagellar biosynthetic protein FliR n=2 Tax=Halocynthiibacter styelae TaxID=2761955 RepID=A0A8J7LLB0_9RHOB|nr:flagellar biosynthetic protein FliR [Paenihalocynthiibacter styelae]